MKSKEKYHIHPKVSRKKWQKRFSNDIRNKEQGEKYWRNNKKQSATVEMRNTQTKSKQKENDGVSYFLFLNVALKQHTSFQLVLTM